jgi:hypothetical protein
MFGDLSLMKNGLNDLDLRKPISVEKHKEAESGNSSVDVIQHSTEESEDPPEMLKDKTVKIIKRT